MQKPTAETSSFARHMGLDVSLAGYLLDAWKLYLGARRAVAAEKSVCDFENPEMIACSLMQAAMAAKYQTESPRLSGLQEAIENMAAAALVANDACCRTSKGAA